jgi:hypothetical protein
VVEAAVRGAGVEDLRRAADRAGDFQLPRAHVTWPARRAESKPGRALRRPSSPGPRWPSA